MAEHKDEQILQAALAAVTGLVTTGANVQRGRVYPVDEDTTAALSVHMGAASPVGEPNVQYQDVDLEVRITAHVRATEDTIETTLNQIKKEVTIAMLADNTLGLAFVHDAWWEGDDDPAPQGGEHLPFSSMTMRYKVKYRRSYTDPSA